MGVGILDTETKLFTHIKIYFSSLETQKVTGFIIGEF